METAFTMDTSSIKFGKGVTKEIGSDFKNMGVNRLMICTDNRVAKLSTMEVVELRSRKSDWNMVILVFQWNPPMSLSSKQLILQEGKI